jgi:hypothetical protein
MKRLFIATLYLISAPMAGAETLTQYVNTCKTELGISSIPAYSCNDSSYTKGMTINGDATARIGYKRIADQVDAVFLCRFFSGGTVGLNGLILHNRSTGKTCFFDSKQNVSVSAPSPTSSDAANYWMTPEDMMDNSNSRCGVCHTNGPYIITDEVVGAMAYFGLVNNGRNLDVEESGYEVVGVEFDEWNDNFTPTNNFPCADACHTLTGGPRIPQKAQASIIDGWMPPAQGSDFMWVNRDTPNASGDHESLSAVRNLYPFAACNGNTPTGIVAQVVGTGITIYSEVYNKFRFFNTQEGFSCLNADQDENIECLDWSVRYQCNGAWSSWIDNDNPSGTGDNEYKADAGVCANPSRIQGKVTVNMPIFGPLTVTIDGAPDKLYRFSPTQGLTCRNEDQLSGNCANYQVRFSCN